jgi:hypothetical protein
MQIDLTAQSPAVCWKEVKGKSQYDEALVKRRTFPKSAMTSCVLIISAALEAAATISNNNDAYRTYQTASPDLLPSAGYPPPWR